MSDEEKKMMAFVVDLVMRLAIRNDDITDADRLALDNIAYEFGFNYIDMKAENFLYDWQKGECDG